MTQKKSTKNIYWTNSASTVDSIIEQNSFGILLIYEYFSNALRKRMIVLCSLTFGCNEMLIPFALE